MFIKHDAKFLPSALISQIFEQVSLAEKFKLWRLHSESFVNFRQEPFKCKKNTHKGVLYYVSKFFKIYLVIFLSLIVQAS